MSPKGLLPLQLPCGVIGKCCGPAGGGALWEVLRFIVNVPLKVIVESWLLLPLSYFLAMR
jgi:hypothetical protein